MKLGDNNPLRTKGKVQEMKKIEVRQAKPYSAPGHFDMKAIKLHGKDESGATKFWVGFSHFLPGGGAEWDESSPTEKVYICVEGEITVKFKDETVVLRPTDSLLIGANEGREIINNTNFPASMYVIGSV